MSTTGTGVGALNTGPGTASAIAAATTMAEKLRFAVEYASLAPSIHNSQPWRFRIRPEEVELWLDRSRRMPVADPEDRELTISCGAALYNLRLAIRRLGYASIVYRFPERRPSVRGLEPVPDLLAIVRPGSRMTPNNDEIELFEAIKQRQTSRAAFSPAVIPLRLKTVLHECAREEGVHLEFLEDETQRGLAAGLVARANQVLLGNESWRSETAKWLRPHSSGAKDGVPVTALGVTGALAAVGKHLAAAINTVKAKWTGDTCRLLAAPAVAIISTKSDTPEGWLIAGEGLEKVLLSACVEGVRASFCNQAIEVSEFRPKLAELASHAGYPQLLITLGYAKLSAATPRRPLEEVLL